VSRLSRASKALAAALVVSALVGASVSGSDRGSQRGRAAHVGPPAAASPSTARSTPTNLRLHDIHTFALAIGDGGLAGDLAARYRGYDLVVVDGQEATRAQVASLHQTGRVVLAYLDVGTIEPGRPWFTRARAYRLDRWAQWGEWYADVSKAGYRRLVAGAVAPQILGKGFDGLFLDNVDMIESHPRQGPGMRALVRALARRVHTAGGVVFAQNGADVLGPLVGTLDGWNREDVSFTYDPGSRSYRPATPGELHAAQSELRRMAAAGKLITATDYLPPGAAGAGAAANNACAAGALPFVSDLGLRLVPQPPLRCPHKQ
jgi:uncharacterized protein (TIGR01370 family)